MYKIATTHELASELRRLLKYARTGYPSRARLSGDLMDLSNRVAVTDPSLCSYCGNPKHSGTNPEPITAAEAKKLWNERDKSGGPGFSLMSRPKLTAAQCETVKLCWDKLPGNFSYASTFRKIMQSGSDKVLGRGK